MFSTYFRNKLSRYEEHVIVGRSVSIHTCTGVRHLPGKMFTHPLRLSFSDKFVLFKRFQRLNWRYQFYLYKKETFKDLISKSNI